MAPVRTAFAAFSDPIIFVFIGGFMIAQAMFVHGVDRRIAYTALSSRFVGTSAARILLVYGGIAMLLSMWISNTATTAMMFPIGLSLAAHLARTGAAGARQFALVTMLITSFAASIGGMATPVGTPPNLIGIGMLERITGEDITFFQWMLLGVPVAALMVGVLTVQFYFVGARGVTLSAGSTDVVREELAKVGAVTRGQRNVLVAFAITVVLWVTPGVLALANLADTAFAQGYARAMPESVAAMVGALLLFVIPLDWRTRRFTLTSERSAED